MAKLHKAEYAAGHNRYADVLPGSLRSRVAHTMVKVPTRSTNPADTYINANYIMNPFTGDARTLIATQGPTEASIYNFWKMVWAEKVLAIVNLCRLEEDGRVWSVNSLGEMRSVLAGPRARQAEHHHRQIRSSLRPCSQAKPILLGARNQHSGYRDPRGQEGAAIPRTAA